MKKADMRDEYTRADFPKLERGKFYKEAVKGTAVVLLDPEVAKAFPNSEAVNKALTSLLAFTRETRKLTEKPKRASRKRSAA